MSFNEVVRLLQAHGCRLVREKGSIHDLEEPTMLDLPYSLVIEATEDPTFFGFYSPDLIGFTGIGHSVEDCMYQARWGMQEHVALLQEQRLPVPPTSLDPTVMVRNEAPRVVA